jgi:ribose transport system substrate-binding protein
MRLRQKSFWSIALVLSVVLFGGAAEAASGCIKGDRKPPYKIGWSDVYLGIPWMTETRGIMDEAVKDLQGQGLVKDLTVANANADAPTQIQQIQSMIDSNTDIILIIAGSATALNRVIEQACNKGIAVVNFDSLVTTDKLTAKVYTDPVDWGRQGAKWLVSQLKGKGDILVLNGVAGVAISEDRWRGAKEVFDAAKDIHIVGITNTEHNVGPAQQAVANLLFAHPKIDGIWSQGGAISAGAILALDKAGVPMVPITGENYKQFMQMWYDRKFPAWATGQPNWIGALSIYAAVWALQGQDVPRDIVIPLPSITNDNLAEYIERGKNMPDDNYIYPPYSLDLYKKIVKDSRK